MGSSPSAFTLKICNVRSLQQSFHAFGPFCILFTFKDMVLCKWCQIKAWIPNKKNGKKKQNKKNKQNFYPCRQRDCLA